MALAVLVTATLHGGFVTRAFCQAPGTQPAYGPPMPQPWSPPPSGPRTITDWDPSQPIPLGYHLKTRARVGPIIAGSIIFGLVYGSTALAAYVIDVRNANPDRASSGGTSHHALYIPIVGPFREASTWPGGPHKTLLIVDGVAQAFGAGLLVFGIVFPKTYLVRNDLSSLKVVPMMIGVRATGLGLAATF
jgi:hypothetical protein